FRFFVPDNIIDVFPKYRLKIQFVRNIEIRGNRFWVTVDHNGLITTFRSGQYPMYTTVIEFYPLSDPVRPRAQYHNFFPIAYNTVVLHKFFTVRGLYFRLK